VLTLFLVTTALLLLVTFDTPGVIDFTCLGVVLTELLDVCGLDDAL
jgi:hypothetical protein